MKGQFEMEIHGHWPTADLTDPIEMRTFIIF